MFYLLEKSLSGFVFALSMFEYFDMLTALIENHDTVKIYVMFTFLRTRGVANSHWKGHVRFHRN